ncbi:uncharacterized protein LOC143180304 [Calliopsis andreniformis]|uniref:uncharacterized protein LOC143180304 n=1 Tax=Calliopsis andreniformis TaxID=337506 RepID=UPI003FCE3CC8
MNLALHGFLLQVIVSILNLQYGTVLCSAGEPGYLDFDNLPETNFSCQGKVIGGYYADVEAGCQMFHVCTIGQKDEIMDIKFLCLNGTVFDQETRVCERVDEVDCSKSERFYNLNLELYGNNAVTLSLHESSDDDEDPADSVDDHQQRTTSARPTTTTTTTTTTSKPSNPSTTPASSTYSHPTGYPQHYQPQPPFPQLHTSQSKSLYDDKNGGYHHQYIFHNGERNNNQQATSYQLFSSQGVSSTTVQTPQVHQIRFSSTNSPQIIHNEPSTVAPLFHSTSSTIQTLLNSNVNSPALINPLFHNHGIASTTEQFSIHSNNPRETSEYRDSGEQNLRPLEAVQSTNKGKVSKLTISPVPTPAESSRTSQSKSSQTSQQQRLSGNFIPTPAADETTVRSFYPTLRSVSKASQSSQSTSEQVTQHIHVLPSVPIPQLKPHQITINLPPSDIQRIVQNPSPLLPSQSRVIVTAKASISDESGRPLNTTQLVTLPLPTIPASYDDYKEGDESFDPFYRDVPKIHNARRATRQISDGKTLLRRKRSTGQTKNSMVSFVYSGDSGRRQDVQVVDISGKEKNREKVAANDNRQDFGSIKDSLLRFRDILFSGDFTDDMIRSVFEGSRLQNKNFGRTVEKKSKESLEDLETKASKNFKARDYEDEEEVVKESKVNRKEHLKDTEAPEKLNNKTSDVEEYIDISSNRENGSKTAEPEVSEKQAETLEVSPKVVEAVVENDAPQLKKNESNSENPPEIDRVIDVVILDPNEYLKMKSSDQGSPENTTEQNLTPTDIPILSTTEQTTEATLLKDDSVGKQDSKNSGKQNDDSVANEQPSKIASEGKVTEEESKTEKPKERVGPKQSTKRKSSKIRSPRRKAITNNENKLQNDEPPKPMDDKGMNETTTTTTTNAPDTNSGADQINKHIFDEPESQTSKEVDTRAVGQHRNYAKNLQTGKDQNVGKENWKGEVNEYETLEKDSKDLKKDQEKVDEVMEPEEKTTSPTLDIDEIEKEDKSIEIQEENISVEEKEYHEKESIEHESMEDESTTVVSNEDSEEVSEEDSGSDHHSKSSRREKSMKLVDSSKEISTHSKDKNRKLSSNEEEENESQDYSTIKSEEISSHEVSSEYHDSTEVSYENIHEVEDEYKDSEGLDESTISSEHKDSEELSAFREEIDEENDESELTSTEQEDCTEGVLKFTDELPKDKKEDASDSKKSSESEVNIAHDYVDDNYEPDNYKERESTDTNNLSDGKTNKEKERTSEESTESESNATTESQATEDKENEKETEKSKDSSIEESDTQTTTSTTTTTTTTTPRPTPPKLFKPIAARKSYNYIPPTTTPNPVVIKPRASLLNPKPAKPPKSYNDLAPKPVIRKFTLLARKATTTMASTSRDEDSTESTELPMTTMEMPVTVTEASRSEENVLEVKSDKDQEKTTKEPEAPMQKDQAAEASKNDQDPSPSEQKFPTNWKKDDENSTKETESFTPYPISRLTTLASTIEKSLKEAESTSTESETPTTPKSFTLVDVEVISTTVQPITSTSSEPDHTEITTSKPMIEEEIPTTSSTKSVYQETTTIPSTTVPSTSSESSSTEATKVETSTTRWINKFATLRRKDGFSCLEKEMYRFYGDARDCRLFHYCSPGFTSRQVLDFRFVCEEGTAFDEASQSCRHDVRDSKCPNRHW